MPLLLLYLRFTIFHSYTLFSPLFFTLFFLCFSGNANTTFDFQTLTLTSLKFLGDAHMFNNSVRLTRDLPVPNSGAGRVLYNKPIRFRRPGNSNPANFKTNFSFKIQNLNPDSIGGGLAFVISPDDEAVGDAGGFLGIPAGAVSVEFDTLMDFEFKDINGNHVGLDLDSMVSRQVADLDRVDVDLRSGELVNSWVEFSGSTQQLDVSISYSNIKPKSPVLSTTINLNEYAKEFMFVGFSGSTQGSTEVHSVEWWAFTSSFDEPDTTPIGSSSPPPPSPPAAFMNPAANAVNSPPPSSMAPSNSNNLTAHTSQKQSKCHNELCKKKAGAVAGVVTAGAFFLALCAVLLIWVYSKKFKKPKRQELLVSGIFKSPKEFTYKELKLATRCFDTTRVIGHGAFGTVYRGVLDTGDVVAIKRCSHSGDEGKAEFLSELSIIGTLRHRNLLRLQGWCHEKGEIMLVYELMPNGSLDKALFESRFTLLWAHRKKILMGVASALAYLHHECENQVIHRDVKASNIMLDEGFNAKLGDFGLAREIDKNKSPDPTVAAGTMGYLAPEYLLTGRASEKTDVYSFGAVVLEVASGRRPIEREATGVKANGHRSSLVDWAWSLHREGRLLEAADPRLGGEFEDGEMMKVLLVGLICSHPDANVRPTMRNVVQMLVGEAEVPVVPRTKPSLSFSTSDLLLNLQDSVSELNEMITLSSSSSESLNGDMLSLV